MKIEINPQKDICSLETYLKTDTGCISLWDSQDNKSNLMVETGSDGNFKVIVNFNQNLSLEDQKNVYKSEKGISLSLVGKLYLGSFEWSGSDQMRAVENNLVDTIILPDGHYVIDVFSILTKDDSGKPKYIKFAFCIFNIEKYTKSEDIEIHAVTKPISLKYTE